MLTKIVDFNFIVAITTVVTIAEILKNNGLATEKSKDLVFVMPFVYILTKSLTEFTDMVNLL